MTTVKHKSKRVKPQPKEGFTPIPKRNEDDTVWYLFSADPNTEEVHYLGCNDKRVVQSIINKRNQDLQCHTVQKGPYKWDRRKEVPTYEQFEAM